LKIIQRIGFLFTDSVLEYIYKHLFVKNSIAWLQKICLIHAILRI